MRGSTTASAGIMSGAVTMSADTARVVVVKTALGTLHMSAGETLNVANTERTMSPDDLNHDSMNLGEILSVVRIEIRTTVGTNLPLRRLRTPARF